MRKRRPIDPELPPRLAAAFFADPHSAGDPFWSIREIARRFRVSPHAANLAVGELVRQGVLDRRGRMGTFVAAHGPQPVSTYEQLVKPHLAVVMPDWTAPEWDNQFGVELRQQLLHGAHARRWNISFYQEPGQLSDPRFPARWRAAGCTALLMLNPTDVAAVPLSQLRASGVPVVSIGHVPAAFGMLGIPVIDGDDADAMYRLVVQLVSEGCERITVAGYLEPRLGMARVNGCRCALEQFHQVMPDDMFLEAFDRGYVLAALARRIESAAAPQVVIFQDFPTALEALNTIPEFARRIQQGIRVAVFDTCFLDRRFPEVPLIEVTLDPAELANRTLTLTERLVAGEAVTSETLLAYRIVWPAKSRK